MVKDVAVRIHGKDIKRFQNTISRISKAMPPAESAKSSNYTKSQIAYSIYDGRYKANKPRTSVAPPVQLFHPVFGHFLDVVKGNHALPDDIIRKTTEYMKAASAIYGNEEERRAALTLLRNILDVNIQMILNKDKMNPDGIVEIALLVGILLFLLFLEEDKNELGDGGLDPSTQTGFSTAHCWAQDKYKQFRNATNCPTFLIATAGPWIVVLGAVTDGVTVQRLTDYVWVGIDSVLNDPRCQSLLCPEDEPGET